MVNKKNLFFITLLVIFTSFGYIIGKNNNIKNNSKAPTDVKIKEQDNKQNFLGSGIQFKNFLVHFDKDQVLITSFEGQPNWPGGSIKASDYPNLYKAEGGGTFFLTAKEINDKLHNKQFIYISKEVFNHGAYSDVYGLVFDPSEGKVVYETPKELAMSSMADIRFLENDSLIRLESYPYYFFASCTQCKLGIIDYESYDHTTKKFIPVNNRFKNDFEKLLSEYQDIADHKCSVNGKQIAVDELLKNSSPNTKCDNTDLPGKEGSNSDFYTIGQFQELRNKINEIISGKAETLLSND